MVTAEQQKNKMDITNCFSYPLMEWGIKSAVLKNCFDFLLCCYCFYFVLSNIFDLLRFCPLMGLKVFGYEVESHLSLNNAFVFQKYADQTFSIKKVFDYRYVNEIFCKILKDHYKRNLFHSIFTPQPPLKQGTLI